MENVRLKISPPWVTYVNEVTALFGNDPDIEIRYENAGPKVVVSVKSPDKAAAIAKLLPEKVNFGNVDLEVVIDTPNGISDLAFPSNKLLFDTAFDRNPVYAFSRAVEDVLSNAITYVVFKNRVVQWWNDNLGDIYGNISTIYQEVAADVFKEAGLYGVYYCTDVEEKVGMPLGEWP